MRIRIVAAARPRIKGRVAELSHGRLLNQADTGMMAMNSCFGTRISGESTGGPRTPQRRQEHRRDSHGLSVLFIFYLHYLSRDPMFLIVNAIVLLGLITAAIGTGLQRSAG